MTTAAAPFEIAALEWFLERNLRVCLESPDAMEARLIHDGWPHNLVLYARALMAEMTGKAGRMEAWRPRGCKEFLGKPLSESTLKGLGSDSSPEKPQEPPECPEGFQSA